MHQQSREISSAQSSEDDLVDLEGVPEDGRQAWFSLLLISLITMAAGTLLYAIVWAVA